jgi:GT2 family glycosyltransferase
MSNKIFHQFFIEHQGKVSDKWTLYLNEYNRLFNNYRDKPISLLEIGIQNGGSLEIWSKYFSNASALIGCDINPDCARLSYDDPRISVIIGDANAPDVSERVFQCSPHFDIIIDDGSHLSSDIIESFALYFPRLVEGGVFVVEDLHCSYLSQFEGGLFDPYSSISFFKHLADIISHEHWGIPKLRADILRGIFTKYGCEIDEKSLAQVHSVEFINSMCVVRKAPAADNRLGRRFIAGSLEMVVSGHREQHGFPYQLDPFHDQSGNPWSARETPPGEVLGEREEQLVSLGITLSERDSHVASLSQTLGEREEQLVSLGITLSERDSHVASLSQTLGEREEQLVSLGITLSERDSHVASLSQIVQAYQDSISWRITKPVRFVGSMIKRIKRALVLSGALFSNLKELKTIAIKVKRKGLTSVVYYSQFLQSEENVAEISRVRGLSPEFLMVLVILAKAILTIKQWWFANHLRSKFTERFLDFFRGVTKTSMTDKISHLRFHIDKPSGLFNSVDGYLVISGWCVDIDANAAGNVRVRIGKAIYQPHEKQREDVQRAFKLGSVSLGFAVVPSLPIGLHRMWIDIEGSDSTWIPVKRALLLRIPRSVFGHQKKNLSYKSWARIEQKRLKKELPELNRHIDVMIHKPKFTIVIDTRQSLDGWKESLQSIREQIYPHHELRTLVNDCTKLPTPLEKGVKSLHGISFIDILGDFIVFIECGQSLHSNALYEFANVINQYPDLDLIYGDEDRINAYGERCNPFYKPDWSPDYLETFNYIGFTACFRTTLARGCFDSAHLYDLALKFTERTAKIRHVAKILGHQAERKIDENALEIASAKDITALQGRLNRTGRQGTVREHKLCCGCYDIQITLKREPLVSVIIPTAGKVVTVGERQIDLITNITNQIINQSTYKNIEIIVVDNGDLSDRQQQTLSDQGCRLITYTKPIFNISKKLNLGVSIANGELLLLMNDDIEILFPAWIERMVEHFEKPHVGVVGAKLLYPDGRTQHVGVVHNYGNPDHVRRLQPKEDAGYYFSTSGVRNFMAVTGALMMTPSNIYREVGGYSEELAVSYNDTDYCLKVQEKGLWIVYAPKVELTHMESQSRVASANMAEVAWYHKQWASQTVLDPYYNEQFLTVASPTFVPSVSKRLL